MSDHGALGVVLGTVAAGELNKPCHVSDLLNSDLHLLPPTWLGSYVGIRVVTIALHSAYLRGLELSLL